MKALNPVQHDIICELQGKLAQAERERDEANAKAQSWFKRLLELGCEFDRDWKNVRAERAEKQRDEARAACAEMRSVFNQFVFEWEDGCCENVYSFPPMAHWEHALSSDCGKGLLAELERKTKALEKIAKWDEKSTWVPVAIARDALKG